MQAAPPHPLRASTCVLAFLAPHVLAASDESDPSRQCRGELQSQRTGASGGAGGTVGTQTQR
jgi:hypothetical protein